MPVPPSFLRTFPLAAAAAQSLDVVAKDTSPSLKHSPSTISSNSNQSSISISIRRRVSTIVSKFHLRTGGGGNGGGGSIGRGRRLRTPSSSTSTSATNSATTSMSKRKSHSTAIEHISSVPWPRSPSRSPSPPSPDIRPPSGLGRRASNISDYEILALDSSQFPTPPPPLSAAVAAVTAPPLAPPRDPVFPKSPNASLILPVRPDTALPSASSLSSRQYPASRRTRTVSSPALLSTLSETPPAPDLTPPTPPPKDALLPPPTPASPTSVPYTPCTPRHARLQARQSPPIPLSLLFPYIPRADLPALSLVSRRFRNAAQLALYRTLVLSAAEDDDTDGCIARLATAPHLAALVTTLVIRAYPPAHGSSFQLALGLALRTMRALTNLTLPAYDADLLLAVTESSSATGGLTHLTLLADTLPFAFFDQFLASNPTIKHLSLPNFIGVPPGPGEVPSTAVPDLISLDASPGLAVSLASGRHSTLREVTLRVASTLYDGLRPAAIFGALLGAGCGQVRVLSLVLAPDVDTRTRGRLLGALAKMSEGLEVLELQLEGTSDEVALQVLYKQVGTLLPSVGALRALRLRAKRTAKTAAETEEGPSRLAVWTRSRSLGSALRCIVFPSGSRWELEQGEWVQVK